MRLGLVGAAACCGIGLRLRRCAGSRSCSGAPGGSHEPVGSAVSFDRWPDRLARVSSPITRVIRPTSPALASDLSRRPQSSRKRRDDGPAHTSGSASRLSRVAVAGPVILPWSAWVALLPPGARLVHAALPADSRPARRLVPPQRLPQPPPPRRMLPVLPSVEQEAAGG